MKNITPTIIYPNAISQPKKIIQIILAIGCLLKSVFIVFPKGNNEKLPILKHCTPKGIPMIVIHQNSPIKIQTKNDQKPTNINHKMFPSNFI
jgi:hypothetical protein